MSALPAWIDKDAWSGYVEMRKAMKKPMTARAEALVIKTLYLLRDRGHDPNEALDQSVIHNWIDVYEPKPKPIANLKPETYQGHAPLTREEIEAAKENKAKVLNLVHGAFKIGRVA